MGEEEGVEAEKLVEEFIEFLDHVFEEVSREGDETRRFLRLLAEINEWFMEKGLGRIIVVGGFAVEVYTGRVYRTMDVDVIVEGAAAKLLEYGLRRFAEKIGRGYVIDRRLLDVKSIDIVGTVYTGSLPPVELVVDGKRVFLEPPEELVVKYLAGWKYWGSTEDRDKALWVYAVWRSRMDMNYLRSRAEAETVSDKLDELEGLYRRLRAELEMAG